MQGKGAFSDVVRSVADEPSGMRPDAVQAFERVAVVQKPYSFEHVVEIEDEPRHHLVVENEFVRAFAVEVGPHDRTLCHRHNHDYLTYVASIADIISAPQDKTPETHLYYDGQCELSPAGMVHVVENLTDAKFRNILLEFLPKAADLRRGPDPRLNGGFASIRLRLDSDRVSVYRLSMLRSAQVEISGPAILASPYEQEVELEELGVGTVKLSGFRDLAWLRPLGNGLVRHTGSRSAWVIVLQLGGSDDQISSVRKPEREPLKILRAHAEKPE